jgi:UDP-3-O-[3-hydroxymyristoyl] N-acetylglucosamine deacetylase
MKTPVILLVDDEASIIHSLRGTLEDEGLIVLCASDGLKAMEIIKSQPVDIVFLDIWLPGMDGLEILKAIKDFNAAIEVVMMTGHGTVSTAVQAVKQGAFDFFEKPFSLDMVIDSIRRIKEKQRAVQESRGDGPRQSQMEGSILLAGDSALIRVIREDVRRFGEGNEHVLLTGEIGVGKETVARLIHAASPAAAKEFHKVNCAFSAGAELEDLLFGSRKTGDETAVHQKGILKGSAGATVYLHSIDVIAPDMQARIARHIDASRSKNAPVRIIASSIRSWDDSPAQRMCDKDFMGCFAGQIHMPPLRNRRGDIPVLIRQFVFFFCQEYGYRTKKVDDEALEMLINYDWPGNVKQLKNLVEKLVVSVPTISISASDVPASMRENMQTGMLRNFDRYGTFDEAETAWRKKFLLYHLKKNNRDIPKTAAMLDLKEKLLRKYIKEYSILLTPESPTTTLYQRTLKKSMVLSGRGLHSGDKTGLILAPLPPNSGIIFGNISSGEIVPANIDYVVSTDYATCLQNTNTNARTIEHLLAVLHAYRITNLMVKINNEVPIMDGSSLNFCDLIEKAGIDEQDESMEEIAVAESYTIGEVGKNKKYMKIEPSDTFSVHYMLQYPNPVGSQEYRFELHSVEGFKQEIAPARTFGFLKDIEALTQKGLASGGRLDNFILVDDEKIVNTTLRFPDEFARHKILDLMGDLYLLGRPVRAKITANMTGHSENIALVRMLRDVFNLSSVGAV